MPEDPIVDEVRKIREAYAAKFNYDLDAIFQDVKASEQASGRQYLRLPARRLNPSEQASAQQESEDPLKRAGKQPSA